MVPAPGDDKIYKNRVSMGVFKGLALLIIRQCLGDIGKEDGIKGN